MNSAQESKNELEAAIRYAENAISSAKQTIESMEFRQEMAQKNYQEQTGREAALEAEVAQLKSLLAAEERESAVLRDTIDRMGDDITGDSVTIKQLQDEVQSQKDIGQGYYDSMMTFKQQLEEAKPTMPVIPKAVAIAIFREGMEYGAGGVCDELDNAGDIEISDRECMGNFEVEYTQWVDLSDHLDTDYLRSKAVDNCDEEWVVDCLKTLCADNKFECRIHGVDDQEEKKND